MTARLTVLGGSSPYTVALIDALAAVNGPLPLAQVVLHGRNEDHLRAVEGYARSKLAGLVPHVGSTVSLEEALEGATLVLHQIRYGGMEGRAEDEAFADAVGVGADETLGPSALRCALRMAPSLTRLAGALTARCRGAWVINLANPLSVSTAVLAMRGVRCVGVCELVGITVRQAAAILNVPVAALEWSYDGLNHRGFVHDLRVDGRDELSRLVATLGDGTLNGIPRELIEALGAIPLKYFLLLVRRLHRDTGRAAFLTRLGQQVFQELRASPLVSPPSLSQRDLRWYPDAVVPAIVALTSTVPHRLVVNVPRKDNLVAEVQADVSSAAVDPVPGTAPNRRVSAWLDVFARHERALLDAVVDPTLDNLTTALAADPILTSIDVKPLARALCRYAQQEGLPSWASM